MLNFKSTTITRIKRTLPQIIVPRHDDEKVLLDCKLSGTDITFRGEEYDVSCLVQDGGDGEYSPDLDKVGDVYDYIVGYVKCADDDGEGFL